MMRKAILLKDPETGLLWLNNYSFNYEGYVDLLNGTTLDLAKCEAVETEFVSYHTIGENSCSLLLLYKNDEGNYAILAPYVDSMGNGFIATSLLPGFCFKAAYGFIRTNGINIVAKNTEGKWGMISLILNDCTWTRYNRAPNFLPIVTARFEYNNEYDALRAANVNIDACSLLWLHSEHPFIYGDLKEQHQNLAVMEDDLTDIRPEEYLKRRG